MAVAKIEQQQFTTSKLSEWICEPKCFHHNEVHGPSEQKRRYVVRQQPDASPAAAQILPPGGRAGTEVSEQIPSAEQRCFDAEPLPEPCFVARVRGLRIQYRVQREHKLIAHPGLPKGGFPWQRSSAC